MMEGESQDWELLHSSDTDSQMVGSPELRNLDEIEGDTEGMVRSDYFTLDNRSRYARTVVAGADENEEGSFESDNPSWIDPGSETRYVRKNSDEFWSDSGSDRSDDRKLNDFEGKNDLVFSENEGSVVGSGGFGETESKNKDYVKLEFNDGKVSAEVQGMDLAKFWSDSGGDSLVSMNFGYIEDNSGEDGKICTGLQSSGEIDGGNGSSVELDGEGNLNRNEGVEVEQIKGIKLVSGDEKRSIVWWKVPFEVLKYCVVRVSPFWSLSVAVAFMGCVILGRRLYKKKRKSQSLQLKVTIDDKKVSQFMSRAARLNEAFSVVRRVPIVRPSMPAAGMNAWPVMSLR